MPKSISNPYPFKKIGFYPYPYPLCSQQIFLLFNRIDRVGNPQIQKHLPSLLSFPSSSLLLSPCFFSSPLLPSFSSSSSSFFFLLGPHQHLSPLAFLFSFSFLLLLSLLPLVSSSPHSYLSSLFFSSIFTLKISKFKQT